MKTCDMEHCDGDHYARGWCRSHYARWRKTGSPEQIHPQRGAVGTKERCCEPDCDREIHARSWCKRHYFRWYRSEGKDQDLTPTPLPDGTEYQRADGYVMVMRRGHAMSNSKGYAVKHRLLMAEHLGRDLLPNENVHHINGKRNDNRLHNLEVWVSTQPAGQRPVDLVTWAEEILGLYGQDVADGKFSPPQAWPLPRDRASTR